MNRRRSPQRKQLAKPGQPMVSGLEVTILKTAGSAALKAISPAKRQIGRYLDRRSLKQELSDGPVSADINSFVGSISPELAQELESFLSSPEMSNIALNLATETVFGKCGRRANRLSKSLKDQLRLFLSLATSINESHLDTAVEIIFSAMSTAVNEYVSALLNDEQPLSPATKASILKVQDSFINSSLRNSELLAKVSSLSAFKTFEDEYNLQVRNLYGTMRLPHAGATRRVPYDKLYVQPTVQFEKNEGSGNTVDDSQLAVNDLASNMFRIVLLGDPGGGKSTMSLKLTYDCASGKGLTGTAAPFLVVLREYAAELSKHMISLLDYLEQICRTPFGITPPVGALEYLLLNGRALVIFDGLDELLDTALRRQVVDAVTGFTHRYPTCPMLVTSRRVGYTDAPLDPDLFGTVGLSEFTPAQVADYVKNWFDLDESESVARREELCGSFLADSELVKDLRVNPLLLSLMCGIYASEHYIPRNRPDVYEKCALLLFDRWDKQRGIKPELSFDAHVQAAMRSLALWLYPQQLSRQGLPRDVLISYMKGYLLKKRFDNEEEAENAAVEFVDFCKGRAWVLTDVGAELYGFTHRTFLEYFAASQIVRENTDPARLFDYLVERLRSGGWEVVAQLALQILNKAVEDGADDFLDILLAYAAEDTEFPVKSKLLAFATQSLTYIVPRPDVLRTMTACIIDFVCSFYNHEEPAGTLTILTYLLGASPENLPLIAKYLFDHLEERLIRDQSDSSALSIALYVDVYSEYTTAESEYRVSSNNRAFWRQQQQLQFERFTDAAETQKRNQSWVAIYLLEHEIASIDEVLEWFGPAALYSPPTNIPISHVMLPLIPRIVLGQGDTSRFGVGARTYSKMAGHQIEVIKNALLALPTPWVDFSTSGKEYHSTGRFVLILLRDIDLAANMTATLSSFILFLATLNDDTKSEMRFSLFSFTLHGRGSGLALELFDKMLDTRNATEGETTSLLSRQDLIAAGIDEDTASVLDQWMSDRNFRFIR
jgi:hypothetical protein